MIKKNKNIENKENVDHSQKGASHVTSDNSQSFNEVSFDVLENAVERRKSLFGYKNKDFKGRAIISSEEMLPDNKSFISKKWEKFRKNPKIVKLSVSILIGLVILISLICALNYFDQQGYFNQVKHSYALKTTIAKIEICDKKIIDLNKFLEKTLNSNTLVDSNVDKDELLKVKEDLNDIYNQIDSISKELDTQSEDYLCSGYAKQTIESRIMMIDVGLKIYDNAKESINVINMTEDFWGDIIKADSFLKESDNLVQSNEPQNYELAKQNSENAVVLLRNLKSKIFELNKLTNAFDFNIYNKYIDTRMQAAQYSVLACQALIDQNLDQISFLNLAYIEKSNEASDIASSISTTPVQVIRADYDLRTRPLIEEFKAARKNAADNDYALRNYLYQ